ncbi:hypothetical protein ACLD43_04585 [Clostridium botulinum]|uniref:hypothetical protein n=1 Tax=Clostridium botulinum TaxID=1491 RepID=UPI003A7FACFE
MSRINSYFVLTFRRHISLNVCKEQKNVIKKSTNISNAKEFVKALKNLRVVLPKNNVLTSVTHSKIIKRLERDKNIKIIKTRKFPIRLPITFEKLQIGNEKNLSEKEQFYYIKFIIEE